MAAQSGAGLLGSLPTGFSANVVNASWAYYSTQKTAVLPVGFNRTVFEAPWEPNVKHDVVEALSVAAPESSTHRRFTSFSNEQLSETNFVAFDERFFAIIGPDAKVEQILVSDPEQSQEAPCYVESTNQVFFAEWGYNHDWQFLLNAETDELKNITTDPPTLNAHGCVYRDGFMYLATDGGEGLPASIVKVDAQTLKAETLINNFYQQPFLGFNDIDMDNNGNIWVTDSISAWGRYMTDYEVPATMPAVYFINTTDMSAQWVFQTDGNANGIATAPDGTLYVDTTGISQGRPNVKDGRKTRALLAFDPTEGGAPLRNERLFFNPVSYYCDGVRVTSGGYVMCVTGDGVDFIDPKTGKDLGRVRIRGEDNLAVNLAYSDHTLWMVSKGGVWKASGIQERLMK